MKKQVKLQGDDLDVETSVASRSTRKGGKQAAKIKETPSTAKKGESADKSPAPAVSVKQPPAPPAPAAAPSKSARGSQAVASPAGKEKDKPDDKKKADHKGTIGTASAKRSGLVVTEQMVEPARKWWLEEDGFRLTDKKWKSLELAGFCFTPEYEPHGVPVLYDKKVIHLPPQSEEVATFWAGVMGSHYETAKIFRANFIADFKAVLEKEAGLIEAKGHLCLGAQSQRGGGAAVAPALAKSAETDGSDDVGASVLQKYCFHLPSNMLKAVASSSSASSSDHKKGKKVAPATFKELADPKQYCQQLRSIKDLNKCDFSRIHAHLTKERDRVKSLSKEQKKRKQEEQKRRDDGFRFCLLDHCREQVGNFQCEPPGLFRGRGEHPKQGVVKPRCLPKDISLNMDADAQPPKCDVVGHSWGDVYHDNTVAGLGSMLDGAKYIQLSTSSSLKMQPDALKYEKARKLSKVIAQIRKDYTKKMTGGMNEEPIFTGLGAAAGPSAASPNPKVDSPSRDQYTLVNPLALKGSEFQKRLSQVRRDLGYFQTNPDKSVKGEEDTHGANPDARVFVGSKGFTEYHLYQDFCAKARQLGCAAYLIDRLALRVGNTKDEDEEADTVGCTTLRVEHVACFEKPAVAGRGGSGCGESRATGATRSTTAGGSGGGNAVGSLVGGGSSSSAAGNAEVSGDENGSKKTMKRKSKADVVVANGTASNGRKGSKAAKGENSVSTSSGAENAENVAATRNNGKKTNKRTSADAAENPANGALVPPQEPPQSASGPLFEYSIKFSFLGKDSVPYENEVPVPKFVHDCMKSLLRGKRRKELLFDAISSSDLNDYFKEFLPGLSAKVFRTYNASITLERELAKFSWDTLRREFDKKHVDVAHTHSAALNLNTKSAASSTTTTLKAVTKDMNLDKLFDRQKPQLLLHFYNQANRAVAVLCNHQRNVAKTHEGQMDVLQQKLDCLNAEMEFLKEHMRKLKSCKSEAARGKLAAKSEQELEELHTRLELECTAEIGRETAGNNDGGTSSRNGGASGALVLQEDDRSGVGSASQNEDNGAQKRKSTVKFQTPVRGGETGAAGGAGGKPVANLNKSAGPMKSGGRGGGEREHTNQKSQDVNGNLERTAAKPPAWQLRKIPGKMEACKEKLLAMSQALVRTEDLMKRREQNKNISREHVEDELHGPAREHSLLQEGGAARRKSLQQNDFVQVSLGTGLRRRVRIRPGS